MGHPEPDSQRYHFVVGIISSALTLVGADALADGSRPVWRADFTMKQLENMPVSAWSAQEEKEKERES